MGQLTIDIGGYSYKLACRDGEEARLEKLARYLNAKVEELTAALGQVSESRMLLMAALMLADELFEAREAGSVGGDAAKAADVAADGAGGVTGGETGGDTAPVVAEMTAFLHAAAARAEALIGALEAKANEG